METNTMTLMAGKYELSIGSVLLPTEVLGDITVTYTEGTIEAETQAGVRRQGSGKTEEANVAFTVFLPSMDYLGIIFPDNYTAKSGTGDAGKITFGGDACSNPTALPINIHPVCEATDKNDIHIYAGIVQKNATVGLTTGDAVSIDVTIDAQPTANGTITFASPDPTQLTKWDVTTQTTVPVEESE